MNSANDKSPPAPALSGRSALLAVFWGLLAMAALLLAGWQWFETRSRLASVQEEVAQRLAEADNAGKENRNALKQMREQIDALRAKQAVNESRFAEFQGQTESLKNLYQEIARSREEASLLEAEQAITLAGQQLQLAGNVRSAVLALQSADARLARLDRAQFMPLRKAVGRDLEKLAALPLVDLAGMSLRIEQGLLGIDQLPLASYGRPTIKPEKMPEDSAPSWWQRMGSEIWAEFKGLVRIQRFDRDEPVLLAPGQEFFLRENLKLRLLNARLALLSRDQTTFRSELKVARSLLSRHFVADDKGVEALQALLRQLAASDLNVELPNLNESLSALRSLRGLAKGKR